MSSMETDLKLDLDAMMTYISDLVSREVSGTEAVAVVPEGCSGDLNVEDLDTPFLLM